MRYALLIYDDEATWDALSPDGVKAAMGGYHDFTERAEARGIVHRSEALRSVAAATSIRRNGAERMVTDGPFVETKEQLGGFYLVECPDLEEALTWARRVPESPGLVVEVRPLAGVS